MILSAIIPTRNRPEDLLKAVVSIYAQNRLPEELIIIDQSSDSTSREKMEHYHAIASVPVKLVYILDPKIPGLVAAKDHAVNIAQGEIVCFLEDDVILEPNYMEEIQRGFLNNPSMMGCCGVVSNLPPLPRNYSRYFYWFHHGIFHDTRVSVFSDKKTNQPALIPSNYLSGGLSAYRSEVFSKVKFDLHNDFFMLEDVDFSTRAAETFGPYFYINTKARLEHKMSLVNRERLGSKYRRKLREYIVFYKKRRQSLGAKRHLLWLLVGLWLETVSHSLKTARLSPVQGYVQGVYDGITWRVKGEY
jgi:GT2 family glycosyltransferase